VRVLAMRRTMFVTPVETASLMLAACSRDVAARERAKALAFVVAAGHGGEEADAWLGAAEDAALAALERHGEATAPELAGQDPYLSATITVGAGSAYEATQKVVSRVLTVLGAEGRAVRTRPRGGWTSTQFRWAALDRWQPAVDLSLDTDAARAGLARRWLERFGPAMLEDLRWWTGWTLGATRRAVAALDTVAVELEQGGDGVVLAGDEEEGEPPEPWVALLPALDPTTMGWKERAWYLGDHGPRLFDRNGNAGPTIWADGRVIGGWAQAPDGEIRIGLLEDGGAETRAAVEARADDLARRIGPARLAPRARARSPLERELLE
jgi:Winged helix DNA-binding domain